MSADEFPYKESLTWWSFTCTHFYWAFQYGVSRTWYDPDWFSYFLAGGMCIMMWATRVMLTGEHWLQIWVTAWSAGHLCGRWHLSGSRTQPHSLLVVLFRSRRFWSPVRWVRPLAGTDSPEESLSLLYFFFSGCKVECIGHWLKMGKIFQGFVTKRKRGHFLSQELTTFSGWRGLTKPEVKKATCANCLGLLA